MQAIEVTGYGGRDQLRLGKPTRPRCKKGEVQVEVKAAGVNALDWRIREGHFRDLFDIEFPWVPGCDMAGVVTRVGKGVSRFRKGDKVFGFVNPPMDSQPGRGTYAEYVSVPEEFLAKKPIQLSYAAAASIPLPALTAWQLLREHAGVSQGEKVLIHGGAGGVGGFTVQLASYMGAWVLATASEPNHDYVLDLGADEVIDYTRTDFVDAVRRRYPQGVDVIIDTIGGETLRRSLDVIRPTGRILSVADPALAAELDGSSVIPHFVTARPDGQTLEKLAAMFDENLLDTSITATFPLEEAAQAQDLSQQGHGRGRIVLTLE
ncbi:MAG: NADP-dependent oxidoreductase [Gammaproteobacteria bacterium]|nr:NADP-dependent oxidoreductase [Gammaproteobacteria bacterium]